MIENWKDIKNYEGLYQISSAGKVLSVARLKEYRVGHFQQMKASILKQCISKLGYHTVTLHNKEGKMKTWRVHRLVATFFIPNPENLPEVNHINGNKSDNSVENLEWCTSSYNKKHACRTGLNPGKTGHTGAKNKLSKSVAQYCLTGELIKVWGGLREAERHGFNSTAIWKVATGRKKTHGGFIWKYADQPSSQNQ